MADAGFGLNGAVWGWRNSVGNLDAVRAVPAILVTID
jgi:hypothetical protein